MKLRPALVAALLAGTLAGCGSILGYDCDKEMDGARSDYGQPQEVTTYDADGYHSHTWWWWSRGLSRTFTWGSDFDCRVSDYRFSPIRSAREVRP
jgi:hypothetical protein